MENKTYNGIKIRELIDILNAKVLCGEELLDNKVDVERIKVLGLVVCHVFDPRKNGKERFRRF